MEGQTDGCARMRSFKRQRHALEQYEFRIESVVANASVSTPTTRASSRNFPSESDTQPMFHFGLRRGGPYESAPRRRVDNE